MSLDRTAVDAAVADGTAASSWSSSPLRAVVDRTAALVLGLLTLPVVAVCLVVSAVVFRANPLFVQDRVGRGGRVVRVPKVRSLPTAVPADADKYDLRGVATGGWSRFLRRTHLDEVPQLWAVVAGTMSLVGPRPEMVGLSATYPVDFVAARTAVLPGMTGAWQVSEAVRGLIVEAPEFDLAYVRGASPALDLWVLWRTLTGVFGASPVTLEELEARTGA